SASVVRKAERDSGREPYVRPSRMKVPLGVSKTANGYSPRVVVETNKPSSSTSRQLPSGRVVRTLDPAEKGRRSSSSQTTVKPSMSSIRPLPARSAWVRAPKQRALSLLRGCRLQSARLVQPETTVLRDHSRSRESRNIDLILRHPPPHLVRRPFTFELVMCPDQTDDPSRGSFRGEEALQLRTATAKLVGEDRARRRIREKAVAGAQYLLQPLDDRIGVLNRTGFFRPVHAPGLDDVAAQPHGQCDRDQHLAAFSLTRREARHRSHQAAEAHARHDQVAHQDEDPGTRVGYDPQREVEKDAADQKRNDEWHRIP